MLWYPAEDRITFGDHGSTEFVDNQISLTFIAAQLRIIVPRLLDPEHRSNKEYLYDHYLSKAFCSLKCY